MKEYIFKVLIEGNTELIKTYANSVEFAIDNLVQIEGVENIFTIEDIEMDKTYDFKGDFQHLERVEEAHTI